jgi:hypothetical protein
MRGAIGEFAQIVLEMAVVIFATALATLLATLPIVVIAGVIYWLWRM